MTSLSHSLITREPSLSLPYSLICPSLSLVVFRSLMMSLTLTRCLSHSVLFLLLTLYLFSLSHDALTLPRSHLFSHSHSLSLSVPCRLSLSALVVSLTHTFSRSPHHAMALSHSPSHSLTALVVSLYFLTHDPSHSFFHPQLPPFQTFSLIHATFSFSHSLVRLSYSPLVCCLSSFGLLVVALTGRLVVSLSHALSFPPSRDHRALSHSSSLTLVDLSCLSLPHSFPSHSFFSSSSVPTRLLQHLSHSYNHSRPHSLSLVLTHRMSLSLPYCLVLSLSSLVLSIVARCLSHSFSLSLFLTLHSLSVNYHYLALISLTHTLLFSLSHDGSFSHSSSLSLVLSLTRHISPTHSLVLPPHEMSLSHSSSLSLVIILLLTRCLSHSFFNPLPFTPSLSFIHSRSQSRSLSLSLTHSLSRTSLLSLLPSLVISLTHCPSRSPPHTSMVLCLSHSSLISHTGCLSSLHVVSLTRSVFPSFSFPLSHS